MPIISFKNNNESAFAKELDKAVLAVALGESIESAISLAPAHFQKRLTELLPIVQQIHSLPLRKVPAANHRHLFIHHTKEQVSRFATIMRTLSTGYAISTAVVILLIVGVSTAAAQSLPGSPLFSLKKTFQNAQISVVARNPESRAQLELTLANQRLAEAQQVFSDNSSNSSDKAQAVQELNSQTQVALNQIQQVASTPSVAKDPNIIQNLESLAKTQASLQAQVDPSAAQSSEQQSQKTIADIQSIVATANGQSAAQISASQNVQTTGIVTAISSTSITVDKNVFNLNSATQYFAINETSANLNDFQVGDTVSIIGSVQGETNLATVITLKQKAAPVSTVAPASPVLSTAPAPNSDSAGNSLSSGNSSTSASGQNQSDTSSTGTSSTSQQNSQNVTGGYILESSTNTGQF
jgi:hypothetical protein